MLMTGAPEQLADERQFACRRNEMQHRPNGQGGSQHTLRSSPALASPTQSAKYIVRSDGTIKFLRGPLAMANPLSQSAPSHLGALIDEDVASAGSSAPASRVVSRAHLLAPLASTLTPSSHQRNMLGNEEEVAGRQGDAEAHDASDLSSRRPNMSQDSVYRHQLSLEAAAAKGKFAPQDVDIQRIASNGLPELDEVGAARLCVPASSLGLRQSAQALEASLNERMHAISSKASQMSRFEFGQRVQRIFNDVMYEMIRQVGVQCAERAKLLATIWTRSSDVINALSALFIDERERHAAQESKLKDELRTSRKDYLLVVQQLEKMVEQEYESQSTLLLESEKRETELCAQINALKDELHGTQASLRKLEVEHRFAAFQKPRALPNVDAYGLEAVLMPGEGGGGGSSSGSKRRHSSMRDQVVSDDDDDDATKKHVASLKAELQRQQLLLLDAAEEIRRLRGEAPNACSTGMMAVPQVEEKGLDPCEELATESDSEDDDASSGKMSPKSGMSNKTARGARNKQRK